MPRCTRWLVRACALLFLTLPFLLMGPFAAVAQDAEEVEQEEVEPPDPPEPDYLALADAPLFLPRSYFYWGTPVGPGRTREAFRTREALVFGLEYALHLPVFSNVRDQMLAGNQWAGAVTLSFEGALRMLTEDSQPVRMPSYRPSLSAQLFYAWQRSG